MDVNPSGCIIYTVEAPRLGSTTMGSTTSNLIKSSLGIKSNTWSAPKLCLLLWVMIQSFDPCNCYKYSCPPFQAFFWRNGAPRASNHYSNNPSFTKTAPHLWMFCLDNKCPVWAPSQGYSRGGRKLLTTPMIILGSLHTSHRFERVSTSRSSTKWDLTWTNQIWQWWRTPLQ